MDAPLTGGIREPDHAVRTVGDQVADVAPSLLQVQLVPLGVGPAHQRVVARARPGLQLHGLHPLLPRRGLLAARTDQQRDGGVVGTLAAVVGAVAEGELALGVCPGYYLEGCPGTGRLHLDSGRRLAGQRSGQEIPVRVGVVLQHGKDGGGAGANPELVVHGRGRVVLDRPLRQGELVLDPVALLLSVGLPGHHVLPVVDLLEVVGYQPGEPLSQLVHDHHVAVLPQSQPGLGTRVRNGGVDVLRRTLTIPHVRGGPRPHGIGTAVEPNRLGRCTAGQHRHHGGRTAVEGLLDESSSPRDQHLVVDGTRRLQDASLGLGHLDGTAGGIQHPVDAIEHHREFPHGGDGEAGSGLKCAQAPFLRGGAVPCDRDQFALLQGRRKHRSRGARGHDRPLAHGYYRVSADRGEAGDRRRLQDVEPVGRGVDDPDLPMPHGYPGARREGAAVAGPRHRCWVELAHGAGHGVIGHDVVAVLEQIEFGALRSGSAIQHPARIIQVPDQEVGRAGHPHAAIVQFHIRARVARVEHRQGHDDGAAGRNSHCRPNPSRITPHGCSSPSGALSQFPHCVGAHSGEQWGAIPAPNRI